jgi:pimeloyl-ACP methyl ester carboxylesterase
LDPSLIDLASRVVREGGLVGLVQAQRAMGPGPLDSPAHQRVCRQRPGYQEFCEHKTLIASPDMWLAITGEMIAQPDRLAALAGLSMPVLVVVGTEDDGFIGDCRELAAAIPGAHLAEIAGGGHSPQFEAPGPWWHAVSAFLSEVPL